MTEEASYIPVSPHQTYTPVPRLTQNQFSSEADEWVLVSKPNEFVSSRVSPSSSPANSIPQNRKAGKTFEDLWFTLTPDEAAKHSYDIIVIGTGMGGGVVAGELFDASSRPGKPAKSVLVIEKGGVPFHSHCLNTSRPTIHGEARGQQNDLFFSLFKEDHQFSSQEQAKEWAGGPMFNLGGRGAAWGLFIPRIHDSAVREYLGEDIHDELISKWYREAEKLVHLSMPTTGADHQQFIDRLNANTEKEGCQWQWGRMASEFNGAKNFGFAAGAYSPIDKLLEIAMSKARDPKTGVPIELENWKIVLNTEVREISWAKDNKHAAGVVVRDANGKEHSIRLKTDSRGEVLSDAAIVLGAGSVHSPAILLRSGMKEHLLSNNGLHLTDHDMFAHVTTFQYHDPSLREKIGSMKLQSYVRLKSGKIALCNLSVDPSSFLPRSSLPHSTRQNEECPQIITVFILPRDLNQGSTIDLDEGEEAIVDAGRGYEFNQQDPDVVELQHLTREIIRSAKESFNIDIHPIDAGANSSHEEQFFWPLELGGGGHELGTIPLRGKQDRYCLDGDLKLKGREGIYVCDLSVFPWAPESNPTLTLVALALRLSSKLCSRDDKTLRAE